MTRPRLLDLFCGAGGAAMGYHRAGFEVVGVDIAPQPHYPFEFHQADALTYPFDGFDAIHASPPCQHYSTATKMQGLDAPDRHPDLIEPTRSRLFASGLPYVIENVRGAPLRASVQLCGTSFGLEGRGFYLRRHRLFETSFPILFAPHPCAHPRGLRALDVTGHANGKRGGASYSPRFPDLFDDLSTRKLLMGIDWMTSDELSEAIPPAYTEWIGRQLLAVLERAA